MEKSHNEINMVDRLKNQWKVSMFRRLISRVVKFILFVYHNPSILLFAVLTVAFLALLILLIIFDRMGEVDTALKYVLFPIYTFSALISGIATKETAVRRLSISLGREPESRWATKSEFLSESGIEKVTLSDLTYNYSGIPVSVDFECGEMYVDSGESHTLIIGSTGSGKTRRLVLPLLNTMARAGESVVVTDPKGELYQETKSLFKKCGHQIICINLRDPECGNAWNPLNIPYSYYKDDEDKARELLRDLGLNILYKKDDSKEPFWENSAADYFAGLALSLFADADEEEVNLNSIFNMSVVGEERYVTSNYIKEYFNLKDKTDFSYMSASGTVYAPNDTKGGILSTFNSKMTVFCSQEKLSKMLGCSDFSMDSIGTEKTAVFVIMHDEKSTYHPLVSAFIKQCYEVLISCAHKNDNGKLKIRTNFVLDEFANLPPITDMSNVATAARSRNIRLNLIIQSAEQLAAQYGKETAEVIKGNCSNWFYLTSKELSLLRDLSELCGKTERIVGLKGIQEEPLVSVSQLQRYKLGEVLIRKDRSHPYKTYLPDISEYDEVWDNCTIQDCSSAPLGKRKEIRIFDIKKFVIEHKRAEMLKQTQTVSDVSPAKQSKDLTDSEVDEMMKNIEKRLKELDAEEAKMKAESAMESKGKRKVVGQEKGQKSSRLAKQLKRLIEIFETNKD